MTDHYTKHDISGDKVKLSLDDLIASAASAVFYARSQMDRYENEIHSASIEVANGNTNMQHTPAFYARCLANSARDYAIAFETYDALVSAKSRDTIEIIK